MIWLLLTTFSSVPTEIAICRDYGGGGDRTRVKSRADNAISRGSSRAPAADGEHAPPLTVWLVITLPLQSIVIWPLHLPGPGILIGPVLWVVLRHLNRRAWRKHFAPRSPEAVTSEAVSATERAEQSHV